MRVCCGAGRWPAADVLMPENSAKLVGQDGILRPIGNRPFRKLHSAARRPISNRLEDYLQASCSFYNDSKIQGPPHEV